MGIGIFQAGRGAFDEDKWCNNPMSALYNNDAYQIHLSEELQVMDLAHLHDPVMMRLLNMEIFNWKLPNSITGPIQGMSYAAILMSQILPHVLDLEDKVGSVELS